LILTSRKPDRIKLLGVEIDNVTFDETLLAIDRLVGWKIPSYIVTPNVDHLITLQEDTFFREIYKNATLVVPDGVPLLWAARFLGTPLTERVTGADLFSAVCQLAADKGFTLFFLGGFPGVAAKAKALLEKRYPEIKIVGTYSPPFGFEKDSQEIEHICSVILESTPDLLFVGLGAPKQEKFIWEYRDIIHVPVSIGVGAAFDFVVGTIRRAPIWVQRCGLEWLFRLSMEPRRLFKRYILKDLVFFKLVYLQKVKQRNKVKKIQPAN